MVRVYDLSKTPQGEVLLVRVFKPKEAFECIRVALRFDGPSDPVEISAFRLPDIGLPQMRQEILNALFFVDSPHWRDSVAKQWEKFGGLFDDAEVSKAIDFK